MLNTDLESIMMNVNNMTTDKFKIHIFSPSIKNSSKLINSSKNFPIIKKLVTNYYNDQWINYYFFTIIIIYISIQQNYALIVKI